MKKLKKYTLAQLEETKEKMSKRELETFIGGGFVYTFNEKGECISSTPDNSFTGDKICIGSNSFLCESSLAFSSYETTYEDDSGFMHSTVGSTIMGGTTELFQFLASNTNVEWIGYYDSEDGQLNGSDCMLMTIHQENFCEGYWDEDLNYNSMVHNHPSQYAQRYTDDDLRFRDELKGSGTTLEKFGVYDVNTGEIRDYSNIPAPDINY